MYVSIIIPSFQRADLLRWNLQSLAMQNIPFDFETIVLNDGIHDNTDELCVLYKKELNIKSIFTGQRNLNGKTQWRVPGFAINIGVKHSIGDIIIICCAEMFHINNTIPLITAPFAQIEDDKLITIPKAKDDDGSFLTHVRASNGAIELSIYNRQPVLENVKFPFFLAMRKSAFVEIGGYDEEFTGTDYDDTDFVGRLVDNGGYYVETDAKVIHLWHPRLTMNPERIPRFNHNKKLYEDRQGIIKRNVDKEWGVIK